jgi:hypothetical protein
MRCITEVRRSSCCVTTLQAHELAQVRIMHRPAVLVVGGFTSHALVSLGTLFLHQLTALGCAESCCAAGCWCVPAGVPRHLEAH